MTDFKYVLTRICLRSGSLTLPGSMLELFPEQGRMTALDTARDEEFELVVAGPRRIGGLGEFMRRHELDVNDEITIRPLEDGRYAFTPKPRPKRPDYRRPEVVAALLDEIVDALADGGRPMTRDEIRVAHPQLPMDFDLERALAGDARLERSGGRWQARSAERDGPPEAPGASEAPAGAERSAADAAPSADAKATDVGAAEDAPAAASTSEAAFPSDGAPGDAPPIPADPAPAKDRPAGDRPAGDRPVEPPTATPPRGARERRSRPAITPYPRGVMFPGDAALAGADEHGDLQLLNRVRDALRRLGFRVEGMSGGNLMAHAELGRRTFRVLAHALPDAQRLDWASLLARRRDTGAQYLAVFGDHRDLNRLHAPAELARATLWSWHGLQRVLDLSQTVLISPVDLEPHFERDGMVKAGVERFERTIGKRIEERGAFSAVLARLATMRAPTIFLLEDLAGELGSPRDQLLKQLERLEQAPFQLVSRVDSGEFCLRYRVGDALLHLSEYALSLRDQLPNRSRERVLAAEDLPASFGLDLEDDPAGDASGDAAGDAVEAEPDEGSDAATADARRAASRPE